MDRIKILNDSSMEYAPRLWAISLLWNRTTGCRKQYFLHTRFLFRTFECLQNEFLKKNKKNKDNQNFVL